MTKFLNFVANAILQSNAGRDANISRKKLKSIDKKCQLLSVYNPE